MTPQLKQWRFLPLAEASGFRAGNLVNEQRMSYLERLAEALLVFDSQCHARDTITRTHCSLQKDHGGMHNFQRNNAELALDTATPMEVADARMLLICSEEADSDE